MTEIKNKEITIIDPLIQENKNALKTETAPENKTRKPSQLVIRDSKSKSQRHDNRRGKEQQSEFNDKLIKLSRINKVTTGGRRLRFKAIVVCGNGKGLVGIGVAKASDVTEAIRKASADARKKVSAVLINKDASIYHEVIGKECSSIILLKPAKQGIGVKAGGSAREVLIAAGIHNIYSKSFGSNNSINLARATLKALKEASDNLYYQNRMQVKQKINEFAKEGKGR